MRWTFVKLSHADRLARRRRLPRTSSARSTPSTGHQHAPPVVSRGVDVERHLPELSTYLGHAHITDTYWYLTATPKLLHYALRRVERSRARTTAMTAISTLPALVQAFFMDRLMQQRQASPHTIASYRDTFRLLLQFAQQRLGKAPSNLTVPEVDTPLLGAFLDHLERERKNSARSRNVRLAAIHSFFRYVALHAPEHSAVAQRVLAMPSKRYSRCPIAFLTPAEVDALLAAPDLTTWSGRRDRALLMLAVQTGLRAAELTRPSLRGHRARLRRARALPGQGPQDSLHTAAQRYRCRCCAVGCASARASLPSRSFQPRAAPR